MEELLFVLRCEKISIMKAKMIDQILNHELNKLAIRKTCIPAEYQAENTKKWLLMNDRLR